MNGMRFVRGLRCALLLFACCIAMPASGDDIYFSVDGQQQGKLPGEQTQKGLEGMMRALSFSAGLEAPFDAASGQPTGNRKHQPLRVTREPGRGTPQLMHAMVTKERLKEVRFDFYALRTISGVKGMAQYQTIRLTNATLVGFKRTAVPAPDQTLGAVRSLEELEFTYEKIELIDQERSVAAQDNWLLPY